MSGRRSRASNLDATMAFGILSHSFARAAVTVVLITTTATTMIPLLFLVIMDDSHFRQIDDYC